MNEIVNNTVENEVENFVENSAENFVENSAENSAENDAENFEAYLAECQANLHHKVQTVPYGEWEWLDGVITNVIVGNAKTGRKVTYKIKLTDGRTITKVSTNKALKIFDEVAESVKATKTHNAREEWDEERWDQEVMAAAAYVGQIFDFGEYGGRIISVVPDRRVNMVLLRIAVPMADGTMKHVHKSIRQIDPEKLLSDDKTDEVRAAYIARYNKRKNGAGASLADKLKTFEARVEKLEKQLAEAKAKAEALGAVIAAKNAALDAEEVYGAPAEDVEPSESSEPADLDDLA